MPRFALLNDRAVVRIGGPDAKNFLQGLVSNDTQKISSTRVIWAALLTPQGKYLADFAMFAAEGAVYLETASESAEALVKKLSMYKLRSDVTIEPAEDWAAAAVFDDGAAAAFGLDETPGAAKAFAGGAAYVDPRLAAAGARIAAPAQSLAAALAEAGLSKTDAEDYDAHRLALGLPGGPRDMTPEKALLLESGFDELNGVDWDKGCYMGQELTARTRYRGLVKKRLIPVDVAGGAPAPGALVLDAEGREAGEIKSSRGGRALALLRLARMAGPLSTEGAAVIPVIPGWMKLPAAEDA
ncbi:MAG: CAF17-like 4Fe-4S cluster assembly/insertion protein YgfZ [Rhodospirillales bacterium]